LFAVVKWLLLPSRGVILAREAKQVTMNCVSEKFGSVNTETLGPVLDLGCFVVIHPEAEHRHTEMLSRMTAVPGVPDRRLCAGGAVLFESTGAVQPL
jgi:hypothetical protein